MTVSKILLQSAIATAETTQTFASMDQLFKKVAKFNFAQKENLTSLQLLQLAIQLGCTSKSFSELKMPETTERRPKGKKGREKLEIDEAKLREVITEVEAANNFTKLGDLWEAVAQTEWAKGLKPRPLTAAVIYQRVKTFGIETSIAKGTKGREKLEIDEAKLREVIAEVESTNNFTKLGDLWEAVAQTEWAKGLKPRPLTAAVIYQRVLEYGIETSIVKGKKGREKLAVDEAELRQTVADVESKKTFTRLGDLWEAIAQTDWAKNAKLSASTIYLRVQEYGIETKTKPAKIRANRTNSVELLVDDADSEVKPAPVIVKHVNDRMTAYNSGVPMRSGYLLTVIPAGNCPHKLTDTSEEAVTEWGKKIVKTFLSQRQQIAPSALAYFARDFYDVFSDEYKTVQKAITTCKFEIYSEGE